MTPPSALRVGRTVDGYYLRVEGRATLREHPALLELFIVQVLDHGPDSLVIDLSGCEYLDDHFLATLLDLARHYGCGPVARFTIAAGTDVSAVFPAFLDAPREALREAPDTNGEELELPPLEPGATDLESHLTDWHCRLARLTEPHQPGFAAHPSFRIAALACP